MVQTKDFAKQNKTKQENHKQTKTAKTQNHDNTERKIFFSTDPINFNSTSSICCVFFFFFRESRDLLSFAELFKCNFPQGNGINLVARILQEGVVDHSLLWEDERSWERGWSGVGHKNAIRNTRAQR